MIFFSSVVLVYSLLFTPVIDSKWIDPSWKKMIPVRGYIQLNNRVFNLSEPLQLPKSIVQKLSPFSQFHQSPSVQLAQSPPVVEPAQAPTEIQSEPQEPAPESSSELAQAPVVEVSSPSTTSTTSTTTTTTTTTTPAPTTPITTTTTSTVAPRAPVKTYVPPSKTVVQSQVVREESVKTPAKTHSVQSQVVREEPVKTPAKTHSVVQSQVVREESVKTPSKISAPKAPTKTLNYSTKQVVQQSPTKYVSPVKTARDISQNHY